MCISGHIIGGKRGVAAEEDEVAKKKCSCETLDWFQFPYQQSGMISALSYRESEMSYCT